MRQMMCAGIILILAGVGLEAEFEIRAASLDAVAGWQRMDSPDGDRAIWVAPAASLTAADIAQARPAQDQNGRRTVSILLTDAGAMKMRELSSAQVGKPIALVLDGKLVWAPIVRDAIGGQAVITGGQNGLTPDDVQRIVAGVAK